MKVKNALLKILIILTFIMPISVYAYSDYIIAGGETIGIEVNSKGVLVVGFYKVDNSYIGKEAGFIIGDRIIKVAKKNVDSIDEMINILEKETNNRIEFTIIRDNDEKTITLELKEINNSLKTGLYVKDTVTGIGTLTYIDPETKVFGALGHEIIEKVTASKFNIDRGIIFGASVLDIIKSADERAGEKTARYDKTKVFGTIKENEISGIFGTYTGSLEDKDKIEVGESSEINLGNAKIKTVLDDETVEEFDINILKINKNSDIKNILFEVVDDKLIEKAGGIIQGMSGSPIIQNNKIIGAVTHVVVNEPTRGYGIFITTMLKEGDK